MLESLGVAFSIFLEPRALLLLIGASCLGIVCGVLPGLSGTTACILLLPASFVLPFEYAIIMLVSTAAASTVGGSVTSVLLGVPGTGVNAATVFDGFPLARQGRGLETVAAAASASAFGGLFGILVLICFIPILRTVVLLIGPPEFLMLVLWGLLIIGSVAGKSMLTGLIAACIGLILAFIGFNPVLGGLRFTFGIAYLWDGLPMTAVFIGIFAIATSIKLAVSGETIAAEGVTVKNSWPEIKKGILTPFKYFGTFIRGSIIGTIIGIVPGVGGVVASFLAYGLTVQAAKDKSMFGKGDMRGVVAPESANNAKDGGSMVPTIAFGIPGSETTAILLGAFLIHGVQPGPEMLNEGMWQTWLIVLVLTAGTLFASPVAVILSRAIVKLTKVHPAYVAPVIFFLGMVGAYSFNRNFMDVVACMVLGTVGYVFICFQIPQTCVIIAFILGGIAERYFYQSMQIGRGDFIGYFLTRPIAIGLAIMIVVTFLGPVIIKAIRKLKSVA